MTEQIHVREGRTQGKVRVELESICYLEDLGLLLTSVSASFYTGIYYDVSPDSSRSPT